MSLSPSCANIPQIINTNNVRGLNASKLLLHVK
ncbi:hypothetical protein BVI1335_70209 [Burkholderia vietnamiensis]|nr:hypothetical protein BVI1335_70209 [Burkholderia vietnamiensis]